MNCIMENNINRFLNCDFYKVLVDLHASIQVNMKVIFAVMNTTWAVVKMKKLLKCDEKNIKCWKK